MGCRMRRLDLTLPTPAENLACDEALLEWAEEQDRDWEFLRLWESPQPVVVVGRSSRIALEVCGDACRERDIPILRRSSGGAAIVAGPGCLMYALVLNPRPEAMTLPVWLRTFLDPNGGINWAELMAGSTLARSPTITIARRDGSMYRRATRCTSACVTCSMRCTYEL